MPALSEILAFRIWRFFEGGNLGILESLDSFLAEMEIGRSYAVVIGVKGREEKLSISKVKD